MEDFDKRIATLARHGHEDSEGFRRLAEARTYVSENELMGWRNPRRFSEPYATRRRGAQGEQPRQRAQEAERMRGRERGER